MTELPVTKRATQIQPFHVMRLLARARELETMGRDIVHMEVGEPDFKTPQPIIDAGLAAVETGNIHYTAATGLTALKQKIAEHYQHTYQVTVNPDHIVITPGSSGALLLSLACLVEPGKNVLLADPGYPCNRNFSYFLNGDVKAIAVDASTNYQLSAELIAANWDENTVAVILASPSNPTGTLIDSTELQAMVKVVENNNGVIVMDEIYHGLVYQHQPHSILEYTDTAFVINSFSKYYGMTGWRVGWCVVPESYITIIDNFAQNIFLAAPTPAQHAALAAFSDETRTILEQRRQSFQERRNYLLPEIKRLGFKVSSEPQGAFYIYADCSAITQDSADFTEQLLEQAGVAITPGMDFGTHKAKQHVRFAYTTSLDRLGEGVKRIKEYISNL
ncbi:Valine--pyruvate aminotransferase [hydrothermal vent metagenome]|uniref:Valine--pyruvate aminotransferase n=1 Tax=hydrothermal vent metagenome TaxID=652676 RepID=A0A3B1AKA5_9ZZZZ